MISAQFQLIWTIYHSLDDSDLTSQPILDILNPLFSLGLFEKLNSDTKNLLDANQKNNEFDFLYPTSLRSTGIVDHEIRAYAQKQSSQTNIQRKFSDFLRIKESEVLLNYQFFYRIYEPNIVVVEIITDSFSGDLSVETLIELASLPKRPGTNLAHYTKRILRLFRERKLNNSPSTQISNKLNFDIYRTYVINFSSEEQTKAFYENNQKSIAGIITKSEDWKKHNNTFVNEMLDKEISYTENEHLIVDKKSALFIGSSKRTVRQNRQLYSVMRLVEVMQVCNLSALKCDPSKASSVSYINKVRKVIETPSLFLNGERLIKTWNHVATELHLASNLDVRLALVHTEDKSMKPYSESNWKLLIHLMVPLAILLVLLRIVSIGLDSTQFLTLAIVCMLLYFIVIVPFLVQIGLYPKSQVPQFYNRILDKVPSLESIFTHISSLLKKKEDTEK